VRRTTLLRGATLAIGLLFAAGAAAQNADAPPLFAALPPVDGAVPANARDAADQALAMMGREDRIAPEARSPCTLADATAIDVIIERARNARVVIINEAHESPRDRAFVEDLAKALAPVGYKTYVSEMLARSAARDEPLYARVRDGDFAAEPASGKLMRTLRTLGYRVVPIDPANAPTGGRHFVDTINARETAYASALINRAIQSGNQSKVLVHVGYGRNRETMERIDRRDVRWMALQLKEITGIDPLTIDQTSFIAERDGVCVGPDGQAMTADRDLYVAHPALAFERNRPTWRRARGEIFVAVPRALKRADVRSIVEARRQGEPVEAAPADRILIDAGEDVPLLLAAGRYTARVWTEGGGWSKEVTVAAAAPPQKAKAKTQRRKKQ
jgi:putative heme iron utilization protein